MVTSIASRGGGGIDVRHVCHYFHTPISQEVETARQNMFGNTAHVVLVLWMQKLRFPSARTPISRPLANVPAGHIRTHAIGNQRFACDDIFLYAVHVTYELNCIAVVA